MRPDAMDHGGFDVRRKGGETFVERLDRFVVDRIALVGAVEPDDQDGATLLDRERARRFRSPLGHGVALPGRP